MNPADARVFKGKCSKCAKTLKFKLNDGLLERDTITFIVNGASNTVDNSYPLSMTLNDYLREVLNLTGYLNFKQFEILTT